MILGGFLTVNLNAQCNTHDKISLVGVVTANHSASVKVQGDRSTNEESINLVELTVVPRVVTKGEDYLISVSTKNRRNGDSFFDIVSFYPPPQKGENRKFLIEVIGDRALNELNISLIPAGDKALLATSEIEVIKAEWIK